MDIINQICWSKVIWFDRFDILLYPDDAKMPAAKQIGCHRQSRETAAGNDEPQDKKNIRKHNILFRLY